MTDTVSPGRIVTYVLTTQDARDINSREDILNFNTAHAGDKYPALVVRTWQGNAINAQVFYDGDGQLWVTSRAQSIEPDEGFWHWPVRV